MVTPDENRLLDEVAAKFAAAESVLFITGAGISADSGLPTYRGIGGLYDDEDTDEGIPIEAALSGAMLRTRPDICWKYIAQIESACRGASYNRAHEIIATLEDVLPRVWVLTQNVDGFHGDAGSRNLIEIHGNVRRLRCMTCGEQRTVESYAHLTIPPRCDCGGGIRPEVVLFGEMLPAVAMGRWHRESMRGFDVVCAIGTSAAFPYIIEPIVNARPGTTTVEINPVRTEVSAAVDYKISGRAAETMEKLWSRIEVITKSP